MAPGASIRTWLLAAGGPLAEFLFLRVVVGFTLAFVVFHSLGGHAAWMTVSNAATLAAYVAYIARRPGPARNPWTWGKVEPLGVVFALGLMGAYLLGRQTLGLIPGRLLELLDVAGHPHSWTMYVLAPIKEELLYRGILLRRLSANLGYWPALILSSLVFAVVGHANPLTAFAMGAWLGYVYGPYGGRNLLLPVVFHILHNLSGHGMVPPPGLIF